MNAESRSKQEQAQRMVLYKSRIDDDKAIV